MKNYKSLILGLLFFTRFLINAEHSYYLTKEEKAQQGWPINFDVPRELPKNLEKGIKKKIDENVQHQVNMIMEWSESQTKDELLSKLDTSKFLNASNDEDTIENRAKKIAKQKIRENLSKEQVLPQTTAQLSYWRQYAPQLLQNAGDYAISWIPQSVKDRINSWSTTKKVRMLGALLASLLLVHNKNKIMDLVNMFSADYSRRAMFIYNPNDPESVKDAEALAQQIINGTPKSSEMLKRFHLKVASSKYPIGSIGDAAMKLVREQLPGDNIPPNINPNSPIQYIRVSRKDLFN